MGGEVEEQVWDLENVYRPQGRLTLSNYASKHVENM